MTTVHITHRPNSAVAAGNIANRFAWLPRLGPTAVFVMELLYEDLGVLHRVEPGDVVDIDLDAVADRVGVKPSVVRKTLARLHGRKLVFWAPEHDTLVTDLGLPDITLATDAVVRTIRRS